MNMAFRNSPTCCEYDGRIIAAQIPFHEPSAKQGYVLYRCYDSPDAFVCKLKTTSSSEIGQTCRSAVLVKPWDDKLHSEDAEDQRPDLSHTVKTILRSSSPVYGGNAPADVNFMVRHPAPEWRARSWCVTLVDGVHRLVARAIAGYFVDPFRNLEDVARVQTDLSPRYQPLCTSTNAESGLCPCVASMH